MSEQKRRKKPRHQSPNPVPPAAEHDPAPSLTADSDDAPPPTKPGGGPGGDEGDS